MDWLKLALRILQTAPLVVAGIEQLHGSASGESKKKMAMDALSIAHAVAHDVLPEQQAAIDAATELTSNVIDGVVSTFNAAKVFPLPAAAAPAAADPDPAPAAVPAAATLAAAGATALGEPQTLADAAKALPPAPAPTLVTKKKKVQQPAPHKRRRGRD